MDITTTPNIFRESVAKVVLSLCAFVLAGSSIIAQNRHPHEWVIGQVSPIDSTSVHDPVMIKQDGTYYLFATGWGIDVYSSTDLQNWKREKAVFSQAPQWAIDTIPDFKGHIWAPDISYHNNQYYLYYSVSAFGKNTSAIGLATNKTLNASDPAFKWVDHGRVIQSYPNQTNWNAIDPNLIVDKNGNAHLAFGSFWDGLKMVELTSDLQKPKVSVDKIPTIASRKKDPLVSENPPAIDNNPVDAGGNAIEAPFIFKHGKYYYLFASIDYCCKGVESSYKMIVGRSKNLYGPYSDKNGVELTRGGGTLLLEGDEHWHGLGHNAVIQDNDQTLLIFHAYDANQNGRSILRIKALKWIKGWPVVSDAPYSEAFTSGSNGR